MQRGKSGSMGFQPESYGSAMLSAADVVHMVGTEEWDHNAKGGEHVITMEPQQFGKSSIHIESAPRCFAPGELEVGDMMVLGMRFPLLRSLHVNVAGQRANSD